MTQMVEKGSSLLSLLRGEHALTMPRSWKGKSLGACCSQAPGCLSEEGNRTSSFDGERD